MLRRSSSIEGVPDYELDVLVWWPPGSKGEADYRKIVSTLNQLCKEHGYGAVPQLAKWIGELWREPELLMKFQQQKERPSRIYGKLPRFPFYQRKPIMKAKIQWTEEERTERIAEGDLDALRLVFWFDN